MSPKLIDKYVESGTLRLEWRDFPYQGQESVDAALAARAAQEQGKFWEYHDLLYETQDQGYSEERLVTLADEVGLDVEEFRSSLESGENEAVVGEDFREGQERGVSGTPTFVINGQTLVGLQSLSVFEQTIERAEQEAEGG
ncbi:MAG: thioredoxin domain-containing protein [Actinomycetota bacterium]|nr:thioredoxin domain-containing protein [Actinomycetota bacterium]